MLRYAGFKAVAIVELDDSTNIDLRNWILGGRCASGGYAAQVEMRERPCRILMLVLAEINE
jgi:hypothetical protein